MNIIQTARLYAIAKHANQLYGDKPYVVHLDEVYHVVLDAKLPLIYQVAAYLHDVVEDTNTPLSEIEKHFGIEIANMVDAVSGFGETRAQRQAQIKQKMMNCPSSIDLKMADRLANMRHSKINKPSLFKKYLKEHIDLAPIFSQGSSVLFDQLEQLVQENTVVVESQPSRLHM